MTWYQWASLLFGSGILVEVFRRVFAELKQNRQETKAIALGVQAMLRNSLKKDYEAAIANGYASITDKENFENMYIQYHNLGVNGVMDGLRVEYMDLPTFPKEGCKNECKNGYDR